MTPPPFAVGVSFPVRRGANSAKALLNYYKYIFAAGICFEPTIRQFVDDIYTFRPSLVLKIVVVEC